VPFSSLKFPPAKNQGDVLVISQWRVKLKLFFTK